MDNLSGTVERHACPIIRKFIRKSVRGGRVSAKVKNYVNDDFENINLDEIKNIEEIKNYQPGEMLKKIK